MNLRKSNTPVKVTTDRIKGFEESLDCVIRIPWAYNLTSVWRLEQQTKLQEPPLLKWISFKVNTLDLTFLKPAKFRMVSTVLPAFIPVLVGAGQRYTWYELQVKRRLYIKGKNKKNTRMKECHYKDKKPVHHNEPITFVFL